MITVNKTSFSREEAATLVARSEARFADSMETLIFHLLSHTDTECVTLSGPTCSGKTTMANKLTDSITKAGKCAVVLSIDDFFKNRTVPKSTEHTVDYDSVSAIDLDYLAECTRKMLRAERTPLPRYDFVSGIRTECAEYVPQADDIIVFEGIQAVYPEVVALFRAYPYKSIYISVAEPISVNGTVFTAEEIRLSRRLVRDFRFRSASPDFTLHLWKGVRENEEKNIYPYMGGCDYHINSLMEYEPFMIAPYLIPLLESVPIDSPYFTEAVQLREKYRCVEGAEIPADLLPENSLYHEFLG